MPIQVGDRTPTVTLKATDMSDVETDDLFRGKRVVLFSVTGAYTPTCSNQHLSGYVTNADAIRAKGVDEPPFLGLPAAEHAAVGEVEHLFARHLAAFCDDTDEHVVEILDHRLGRSAGFRRERLQRVGPRLHWTALDSLRLDAEFFQQPGDVGGPLSKFQQRLFLAWQFQHIENSVGRQYFKNFH